MLPFLAAILHPMNSNKLPTVLLSPSPRAPLPSPSLLIRAPLSTEDNNSTTTGSDLDPLFSSDYDDDDPNGFRFGSGPESAPDEVSGSMPVARLTKDDDEEDATEEDVFDDVDGAGFVVRVPVHDEDDSYDPNPSSEDEHDDNSEIDSDGFSTVARVSSQRGSPSPSPSPTLAVGDVDGGKLSEYAKPESPKGVLGETGEGLVTDGVLGENPNLDVSVGFEVVGGTGDDSGDFEAETLEDGLKEASYIFQELEVLKPMGVESDATEIEKDGGDEDFNAEGKFIGDDTGSENGRVLGENPNAEENDEKDEVSGRNPKSNNPVKDEVLSESLNLSENARGDVAGDSMDGTDQENGDEHLDAPDEKDEIFGSGSERMNSINKGEIASMVMEVQSNTIQIKMDEVEEDSKHKELESKAAEIGVDNAIADSSKSHKLDDEASESGSEQNSINKVEIALESMEVNSNSIEMEMDEVVENSKRKELESRATEIKEIDNPFADASETHEPDDEDGFVVMDSGKSESSASKLDCGKEIKVNEGVNRGSHSLADSDIAANSSDTPNAVNQVQTSLVEEKAVTKSEETSIESEAKPRYAENGDLFEGSSQTSGTGKETVTHAAEGAENIDEKWTKEVERQQISDEQMITKLDEGLSSSRDCPQNITKEIIRDEEKEKDFAALLELFRAATSSSTNSNNTVTTSDATGILSANLPAGLSSSVGPLKPAQSRQSRPTILTSSNFAVASMPDNPMTEEEEEKFHEKVEMIRVKFLRLVHRLGHSPEGSVATSVLYHLARTEDMKYRMFNFQSARKKALELEREEKDKLDFCCNILVIGKAGVGKSATINSIFEEEKSNTNAFKSETSVRKIEGIVDGIKIRVLDTPGLKPFLLDQASNRKILSSVKKFMKRCPPDVVIYMDRFDTQTRDSNDLPLLRSITTTLGSSIWSNAVIALTHAAVAPPEGPTGLPLSYEVTVGHRSHIVQQSIQQATGDMRLMNPVVLVENHPSCRRNGEGQRVLPNGSSWRSELLLLCFSSKILSEANSLSKFQDSLVQRLFKYSFRSPPMQIFLSSLLESKPHPKLASDRGNDHSDIDLDDFSDQEDEEDEYDQLPPFRPLTKSQIAKLTKEHKRAYFDEYDYRVKLLQKKQWKEEIRRLKEIKRGKNGKGERVYGDIPEVFDDSPTTLQTPLPDMVLPPSFDSDNPVYRYRFLEPSTQFLTGFLLDTHCWDHDYGYDEVSLEKLHAIAARFPAAVSVRLRKDKKDFSIHLDSSVSAKHGESGSSLASFDIQTIGKQMAYFFRGETMFRNLKKNKTTAGVSLTCLGDTVATGLKLEDQVSVGKRVNLGISTGVVRAQDDVAYGANLEATLMKKDYPIGQALAILGLSLIRYHGDLAYGGSLQYEVSSGRNSKMAIRVGMNNKKSGQITVRTSKSDQLEIALMSLIPIAICIFRRIWPGESSSGERHTSQFS